jgi:long-subunit fatty acid transport protein
MNTGFFGSAKSQDEGVDIEQVIAGNFFGFSARQMAMGGTGILAMDGTALFYNPASLARIPRIEFNVGFSYQRFNDEIGTRGLAQPVPNYVTEDFTTNTRLNSMILSVPYPTYRGSLVFALGVARVSDFDWISSFYYREEDAGETNTYVEDVLESGGLNEWAFGFGVDLSPRSSFGGALLLYSGKHEYNLDKYVYSTSAADRRMEQLLEYRYFGVGGKFGLTFQLSHRFGMGMTVETPVTLNVKQDGSESVNGGIPTPYATAEYDLKRPFIFSTGLAARVNYLTMQLDIDYTDWTQLSFGDNYTMEPQNDIFRRYYRDVLRFKVGGEYVLPSWGLSLRAGYLNDPLPYKDIDRVYDGGARQAVTLGLGLLVDQVMMIDIAYVRGMYNSDIYLEPVASEFQDEIILSEDVSYNRVYLSASYRF